MKRCFVQCVLALTGSVHVWITRTARWRIGARCIVTLAAILIPCTANTFAQRANSRRAEKIAVETETTEEVQAMADKRWVSTDGDMANAASYAPSGVPISNDSLFCDGSSNLGAVSGMATLAAVNLTRFWMQSTYFGSFGASGNPFSAQIKYLVHNGHGSLHHTFTDVHTAGLGSYWVIDSPNLHDAYTLEGGISDSKINLYFVNGNSRIVDSGSAISLGGIFVGSRTQPSQPTVTIGTLLNVLVNYYQESGHVTTKVPLGPVTGAGVSIIDGGTLVYDALGTSAWTQLVIAGGYVEYNGTGDLTECIISSGTLDMTRDSRAKTIGTLTVMPGGNFLTHSNILVSKTIDLRGSYPILP
jgi:hypothetical protein